MRTIFTLAFLCLTAPALAQDVAVPDTVDWHRYFPLEIGNEWQYWNSDAAFGIQITGDTLLEGMNFFVLKTCSDREDNPRRCGDDEFIRYREEDATIITRYVIDGVPGYESYWPIPCSLGHPLGAGEHCRAFTEVDSAFIIAPDTLYGVISKTLAQSNFASTFMADIGLINNNTEMSTARIIYAKVGDREYGTRAFVFPTAIDPDEAPGGHQTDRVALFPNPASDEITIGFRVLVPGETRIEIYDLLGRLVKSEVAGFLSIGNHAFSPDLSGLPAGSYFVRVISGGAVAGAGRFVIVP